MVKQDSRYPDGYHGWINRETWLAYLWLSNDPVAYCRAVELARKGPKALRDWVEGCIAPGEASLASDLALTALERIDWEEIQKALLEG